VAKQKTWRRPVPKGAYGGHTETCGLNRLHILALTTPAVTYFTYALLRVLTLKQYD